MANWQERGYVPDSEDDDDDLAQHKSLFTLHENGDQRTENTAPTTALCKVDRDETGDHFVSPTVERLEEVIGHGLSVVREALSGSDRYYNNRSSQDESPLSSPPASPGVLLDSPRQVISQQHIGDIEAVSTFTQNHFRSFRQRTAIQQKPYSLEDAKYRQQFQERGLQPVRFHHQPSPELGQATDESQISDLQIATQVTSLSGYSSQISDDQQDRDVSTLDSTLDGAVESMLFDDNAELPDLSSIIKTADSRRNRPGKMATKRKMPPSSRPQKTPLRLKLYELPSSPHGIHESGKNRHGKEEDSFPSPPRSENSSSSASPPAVDGRNGLASPPALPTPLVSSEVHSRKRFVIDDDSGSDVTSTRPPKDIGREQSADLSSSEDDSQRVRAVAQRTRGVLPASWMRLDNAKHGSKSIQKRAKDVATQNMAEKGVAVRRRISTRQELLNESDVAKAIISSDSEMELSTGLQFDIADAESLSTSGSAWDRLDEDIRDYSVAEEDQVDRMLPSVNRSTSAKPRRHKQQCLSQSYFSSVAPPAHGVRSRSRSQIGYGRSRGEATTKRRPQKKRKIGETGHTITVLDAPGLRSPTKAHQPFFLRVAARAARNASSSGHPMPIQPKSHMFSLAIAEDNSDIQSALGETYQRARAIASQGHERHISHNGTPGRMSPKPQITNQASRSAGELESLKASSRVLLQRSSRGRVLNPVPNPPSHLDRSHPSTALRLTRLKALLPLTNRSGHGRFLSRTSAIRVAQVEEPSISSRNEKTLRVLQRPLHQNIKPSRNTAINARKPEPVAENIPRKQPRKRKPVQLKLVTTSDINGGYDREKRRVVELGEDENAITLNDLHDESEQTNTTKALNRIKNISLDALIPKDVRGGIIESQGLKAPIKGTDNSLLQDDGSLGQEIVLPLLNLKDVETRLECSWNAWTTKTFMDNYVVASQHLEGSKPQASIHERENLSHSFDQMLTIIGANPFLGDQTDALFEVNYVGIYKIAQLLTRQDSKKSCFSQFDVTLVNQILVLAAKTSALQNQHDASVYFRSGEARTPPQMKALELQLACQALKIASAEAGILAWLEKCANTSWYHGTVNANHLPQCETILLVIRACENSEQGLEQFWHILAGIVGNETNPAGTELSYALLVILFFASLLSYAEKGASNGATQRHDAVPQAVLADLLSKSKNTPSQQKPERALQVEDARLMTYSILCKIWQTYGWQPSQKILVIWFQDLQRFWFNDHSDMRSSHMRREKQNSFRLFLQALPLHIVKIHQEDSEPATQKLRSFLFSLIPNRGRIGEQGQIGDKKRTLHIHDVQLIQNLFDLHVEMIRLAPRLAPRPRTLELKVDFSTAHLAICKVALSAWESLVPNNEHEISVITDLASWYQSITNQSIQRWHLAEREVRAELDQSSHIISAQTVQDIIRANQEEASSLLERVIESASRQLRMCSGAERAYVVLVCEMVQSLSKIAFTESVLPHRLTMQALEAVEAAMQELTPTMRPHVVPLLVQCIKQIISTQLGPKAKECKKIMRLSIQLYVSVARAAIAIRHKHWDDFLAPSSSYALEMLVSNSKLHDATTVFYASFIDADAPPFALEYRHRVFDHWLRDLLRVDAEQSFVHLLTRSIFQHEKESLMLSALSDQFKASDGSFSEAAIEQSFSDIRPAVVKHVIRQLYAQQSEPEADWLVGGLEKADAPKLLSTIFGTMKTTWLSLSTQHDAQAEYEHLIDDSLTEYELFSRDDFQLDPWFYSALKSTIRRKYSLNRAFEIRGSRCEMQHSLQDIASTFGNELEDAIRLDRSDEFLFQLKEIFLPTDLSFIVEDNKYSRYSIDLKAQADLIATDFPQYFAAVLGGNAYDSAKAELLCELLCYILENLELRIDSLDSDMVVPMLDAIASVITSLRQVMDAGWMNFDLGFKMTRLSFEWMVRMKQDSVSPHFWEDVEVLCQVAAAHDSNEAMLLLEAVMEQAL